MSDITPSNTQNQAIAAIKEWFQTRTKTQQVFRLFGYAGTGKSTVLKFTLEELGIKPHRRGGEGEPCVPGVVTATFTGKAALVLRRKGTKARTIHSLIYSVIEATEEEVEAAEKKIDEAFANGQFSGLATFGIAQFTGLQSGDKRGVRRQDAHLTFETWKHDGIDVI